MSALPRGSEVEMWGRDERKCSGWFESLERWRTKKTTLWQTPFWLGATQISVDTRGVQCEFFFFFLIFWTTTKSELKFNKTLFWHISSFCSTHKGREAPVEGRCWTRSKRHRLTETWIHIFLTRGQECAGASASLMIYHARWSLLHPHKRRTFSLVPDGPPVRKESSAQTGK